MTVEVFSANRAATTVSSGGTDAPSSGTAETLTVASSSGFPAASSSASPPTQFHAADPAAPAEMFAITNVSGTTWTATRGAEGTTPVTHAPGFTLEQVVTTGALGQFLQSPQIDTAASDIQLLGTQAAGSTGKPADAGHVHPAAGMWLPPDNSLLGANFPLPAINSTGLMTKGTLYLAKLLIRSALTVTDLWLVLDDGGSGATSGTFVGLYSSAGTLLTGSADQASNFQAFHQSYALTTPQALTAGSFVWAALLSNMASTQPTLAGGYLGGTGAFNSNMGLSASAFMFATNGTSLTSLPGTITPSSNSGSSAINLWCGFS